MVQTQFPAVSVQKHPPSRGPCCASSLHFSSPRAPTGTGTSSRDTAVGPRLCIVRDGDFFSALRSRQASVVTDHVDTVTEDGIVLQSGQVLKAHVIVAATGIQLKFGGGIQFSVNNLPVDLADRFAWKQCMLQDVPNLVFSFGYAENSWTLGADCAATVMVRVMKELQRQRLTCAAPRMDASEAKTMEPRPLWRLTSTYLRNMKSVFPKGGTGQWRPRRYYFSDAWAASWGGMKGLVME
ncbi:hypothetical protein J3459_019276 [Metarhizium acridum]|nr:hypothetical protein J3459_019276 [Metarhizium acridum]